MNKVTKKALEIKIYFNLNKGYIQGYYNSIGGDLAGNRSQHKAALL